MNPGRYTEKDPSEVKEAQRIYAALRFADKVEYFIRNPDEPNRTSMLARDGVLVPELRTHHYLHMQLSTVYQCLDGVRRWLDVKKTGGKVSMAAPSHGGYTLIRNAFDCGTVALWLMESDDAMSRVRRLLTLYGDENLNHVRFCRDVGIDTAWFGPKMDRLDAFASKAGIQGWLMPRTNGQRRDYRKSGRPIDELPPMVDMLSSVESRARVPDAGASWVGLWRLCSGYAHGKQWAKIRGDTMVEVEDSASGTLMHQTTSYATLAMVLGEALVLFNYAIRRYVYLMGFRDSDPHESEPRETAQSLINTIDIRPLQR